MDNNFLWLNRPLALERSFVANLARNISAGKIAFKEDKTRTIGLEVYDDIAVIKVQGALIPGNISCGFMTGYDFIRQKLSEAINNSQIKKIVLLIDSPGGVASGCLDLAETIYKLRGEKLIVAIVDDCAYSAAYAIASAADIITVPRAGGIGSIGVIAMHTDITEMLDNMGVKITTITYGKHKAERAETIPLSDGAKERMQADVNKIGEWFVELVARNRKLSPQKIRDLEASTFLGSDGVEIGLADFVLTPDQAFLSNQSY